MRRRVRRRQNGNRDGFRQFNPPANNRNAGTSRYAKSARHCESTRWFSAVQSSDQQHSAERDEQLKSGALAISLRLRTWRLPPVHSAADEQHSVLGVSEMRVRIVRSRNAALFRIRPQKTVVAFRPFTPPSNSGVSRGASSGNYSRGGNTNYWNRTAPSPASPRSYGSSPNGYGGGASRPQLDMRQPIVRGPSYGGNSRGGYSSAPPSYGGSRGAPSYSAPRSSAPSYGGGSHSAPSYGGGGGGSCPEVAEAAIQRRWRWRGSFQPWWWRPLKWRTSLDPRLQ